MAEVQKHKYDVLVGALVSRKVNPLKPEMVLVWDEFHNIRFSVAAPTFEDAEEQARKRVEYALGQPRSEWDGKTWALKSVTLDADTQIVTKPSGLVVPS